MSTIFKIQPVLLCGGFSLRLWPISTTTPKQFIPLGTKGTLLEETLRRIALIAENKDYEYYDPILIMHKSHKLPPELSKHESNVVYEDYANDTAVAVGKAALEIKKRYVDEPVVMLVLPADHYIYNVDSFVRDIVAGIHQVTEKNIILYGIDPTSPETKYGYIISSTTGVKFREKPNISLALELLDQGAVWNSGVFAANTDLVLDCLHKSTYNIMDWIYHPRNGKTASFDVAVLQEYHTIYAHHCSGWRWSDVGTWDSFTDIPEIQEEMKQLSNVVIADSTNINVLNRSSGNVVVIGCQDLLIVTNKSDILIMSKNGDYNNQLKDIATRISK